jgi:hypothetical protein
MSAISNPSYSVREFTKAAAAYMQRRFHEERLKNISGTEDASQLGIMGMTLMPITLPIPLVVECDQLAQMLAKAFYSPCKPSAHDAVYSALSTLTLYCSGL